MVDNCVFYNSTLIGFTRILAIAQGKTGWSPTLENWENDEKNSLHAKIREVEKNKKIREQSGNFKSHVKKLTC